VFVLAINSAFEGLRHPLALRVGEFIPNKHNSLR